MMPPVMSAGVFDCDLLMCSVATLYSCDSSVTNCVYLDVDVSKSKGHLSYFILCRIMKCAPIIAVFVFRVLMLRVCQLIAHIKNTLNQ